MAPLLLSLLFLTAAPKATPRAPADADYAFFIPDFSAVGALTPFLDAGAEHSGLLRRESWRNDVHPLLRLDFTRKDSLLEAGIDPAGSGTLSFKDTTTFSCVTLSDPKKYEGACGERLKGLGVPFRKDVDGVAIVGAKDSLDRVLAGYAIRGKESCAISAEGASVAKPLLELGKLLGKPPTGPGWKNAVGLAGEAVLIFPRFAVGLKGSGLTMTSEVRTTRLPIAKLAGAGPSPYAGVSYDAMLWARTRVDPAQLGAQLGQVANQLVRICPGCDPAVLNEAATALGPTLSGSTLLFIQQVKVQGSLRTNAGRIFANRGAMLAEASDPKAARAAIDTLAKLKGAKPNEDGVGLQLRDGELRIGVRGSQVYLSDDAAALEALFSALPAAPGKQAHGAELAIDPERVAKALGQVPVVDVLAVPELAALLAASAEAGPLLLASEKLTGYADTDPGPAVHGQLVWTLKKPRN